MELVFLSSTRPPVALGATGQWPGSRSGMPPPIAWTPSNPWNAAKEVLQKAAQQITHPGEPGMPVDHPDFCGHILSHEHADHSHYDLAHSDSMRGATCGPFVGRSLDRLLSVNPRGRTFVLAREYLDSQLPAVQRSAAQHRVHPYFIGWEDMADRHDLGGLITARLRYWATRQRTHDLDDFKVEKSKCVMLEFFQRNELPVPKVLGLYSTPHQVSHALNSSLPKSLDITAWPIFIKACHLTQGSLRSVRKVNSRSQLEQHSLALGCWLRHMYARRADDAFRPWTRESNELTDTVAPGFAVQAPVQTWLEPPSASGPGGRAIVLELKIEVLYGHAYLAVENLYGTFFIRDTPRNPSSASTGVAGGAANAACLSRDGELSTSWYNETGLWRSISGRPIECAWQLAERTARTMGADGVRIDIFLLPAAPHCVLNEISLSSAMRYDAHEPSLAYLWTSPELRSAVRRNVMTEPAASTPVYMLDKTVAGQ